MNYNILTWNSSTQLGVIQIDLKEKGIYAPDMYGTKPPLSFDFTNLNYIEQENTYLKDNQAMSEQEKAEVKSLLMSLVDTIPVSWYKREILNVAKSYLRYSDAFFIRQMETGVPMPAGISENRAKARILDGVVKEATTKEEIANAIAEVEKFKLLTGAINE